MDKSMVEFTRPNYLQAGDSSLTRAAMHGIGASQPATPATSGATSPTSPAS